MIAFVRGVIFTAAWTGFRLKVTGSISTKTGLAPIRAMEPAVAKNVYGLVMTSSPEPIPSAISAISRASVPEETPHACAQPQ